MKRLMSIGVLLLMFSTGAQAAPTLGTYDVAPADWTETYYGGGPRLLGNMLSAGPGFPWSFSGAVLTNVDVLSDVGGVIVYETTYTGGTLVLAPNPPMWGGAGWSIALVSTTVIATNDNGSESLTISANGEFVTEPGYWGVLEAAGSPSGPPAGMPAVVSGVLDVATITIQDTPVGATPTPAPGALLLGSMGMGIVGWLRRRRIV